ncbi:MAG: acyl-CoA desaturase [Deltaproteobacteria bacterium]|nr:acyl-CoA desaturase [Deltaproteobacteria bacterium]
MMEGSLYSAEGSDTLEVPAHQLRPRWSLRAVPFILVHLLPLAAFWLPVSLLDWLVCFVLFAVRMLFFAAFTHRYFCHRAFRTSRVFQFIMACLGTTSGLRSPLWFASVHWVHHRFPDTDRDVHSPRRGFWFSHVGWLFCPRWDETRTKHLGSLNDYPELLWLDRNWLVPPTVVAALTLGLGGWSTFIIGFVLSTTILLHVTLCGASVAHVMGTRRFDTADTSGNVAWLALISFGEGWHNNHHQHPRSARLGLTSRELDLGYLFLLGLERLGLIWDLRLPQSDALRRQTESE